MVRGRLTYIRALELQACVPRSHAATLGTPRTADVGSKFPTHSTPALNVASPTWGDSKRLGEGGASWTSWEPTSPAGPSRAVASPAPSMDPLTSPEAPGHVRFSDPPPPALDAAHDDELYALAKTYFDRENYHACVQLLDKQAALSDRARFLQVFAKLQIYEQHLGHSGEGLPPLPYAEAGSSAAVPSPLTDLLEPLRAPRDPFLLFLKGVLLRKLHKRVEAMDCLLSSVQAFPYNWSAWKELDRTLDLKRGEREQILDLLPNSFMSVFFLEYSQRQSTQVDAAHLARIDALLAHFPDSAYLITSRAQSLYLHQELDEAAETFQHALELQPYRLEGISEYSNTLYVLDRADMLAQLVQQFSHVDDSPEVWCMRGNFYNQRSEHFRAVESFKQALRLDHECVAAWILLGHEYLELKNSHAAAEMYRRAIEINAHDYRPWHGLGQVYELNEAWSAAIDYYQQCAVIRPHDARMWASLGVCYERLGRRASAIACFRRHLTCPLTQLESVEAITRLIELYEREGDTANATLYHCLLVQVIDQHVGHMDPSLAARFAYSYIVAARYDMGELDGTLYHSPQDQRSGRPARPTHPRGDLQRAHDYLQKVLLAGTDMTPLAEELLAKLAALRAT